MFVPRAATSGDAPKSVGRKKVRLHRTTELTGRGKDIEAPGDVVTHPQRVPRKHPEEPGTPELPGAVASTPHRAQMLARGAEDPDFPAGTVHNRDRSVRKPGRMSDLVEQVRLVTLDRADGQDGRIAKDAPGVRAQRLAGDDLDAGAVDRDSGALLQQCLFATGNGGNDEKRHPQSPDGSAHVLRTVAIPEHRSSPGGDRSTTPCRFGEVP